LGAYYVPLPPPSGGTFVIRTTGTPRAVLASLTDIARVLDPNLPIARSQTMEERVRRTVRLRRAVVSLLGVLGALTLLLASVGIYGVTAHIQVCIEKKKCQKHWPQPQTGASASAQRATEERRRTEEERRRQEQDHRRALFEQHIRPNTLKALAAATQRRTFMFGDHLRV